MTRYDFVLGVFRIIFKIATNVKITGLENLPSGEPFILAINHRGIIDAPLIFSQIPVKHITPFAADKWEHTFFIGELLRWVDTIFVTRGEVDRQALKAALKILNNNDVLGMAPEGTRSRTGTLIRGKPGIAYLATRAKVPILPVGLSGDVSIKQLLKLKRLHLQIAVGPLIHISPPTGPDKTAQLQQAADNVMIAIARLISPDLHGVYANAVNGGEIIDAD